MTVQAGHVFEKTIRLNRHLVGTARTDIVGIEQARATREILEAAAMAGVPDSRLGPERREVTWEKRGPNATPYDLDLRPCSADDPDRLFRVERIWREVLGGGDD